MDGVKGMGVEGLAGLFAGEEAAAAGCTAGVVAAAGGGCGDCLPVAEVRALLAPFRPPPMESLRGAKAGGLNTLFSPIGGTCDGRRCGDPGGATSFTPR